MPSYFESLSMVALEAWALGRPVLANAACDVLHGPVPAQQRGPVLPGLQRVLRDAAHARRHARAGCGARPERPPVFPAALQLAGDRAQVHRHARPADARAASTARHRADARLVGAAAPRASKPPTPVVARLPEGRGATELPTRPIERSGDWLTIARSASGDSDPPIARSCRFAVTATPGRDAQDARARADARSRQSGQRAPDRAIDRLQPRPSPTEADAPRPPPQLRGRRRTPGGR